jgi:hypothetical protein
MIGRNCVTIEKNELCVRGILYRMMCLNTLAGPNTECGGGSVCGHNARPAM